MQVNLSWQPVTGALYYKVYRGLFTGGPYDLIGTSNPAQSDPVTTYQDGPDTLVNGQDYFYVVSAVTADGESSYGTEFPAPVPTQPSSPLSLTGVVV
jgi:hypothetical protein